MSLLVIPVETNLMPKEIPFDGNFLDILYREIGCNLVDRVELASGVDMWLDDEGLLVNEPKINWTATLLARIYGYPADGFAGIAVLAGTKVTDEGIDSADLPESEIKFIKDTVNMMT